MEAIKHSDTPQNDPKMGQSVFRAVMRHCKCDTGESVETVGLSASMFGYVVSFYGEMESNHELIVEEFGHNIKDGWIDCTPTEVQMETMKKALETEVAKLSKLIEEEELEEAITLQADADELRYGHPGAIYGKWY